MAASYVTLRLPRLRAREPNAVLVKELRSRFRGPRAFAALTSFLVLLVSIAVLFFWMQVRTFSPGGYTGPDALNQAAYIGRLIFNSVAFMELMFMAFIAPSLTMNTISGEVERQTYELLLATPLSGWAILRGKVGAALAYVLLLIFSALPVMSLAFLFGGVSAIAVVQAQLTIFVAGLLFLMVGAFWSCHTRRTARSAVLSYLTVGGLCVAPIFVVFIIGAILRTSWDQNSVLFLMLMQVTPVVSLAAVTFLQESSNQVNDLNLFWAQSMLLHELLLMLLYAFAGARIRPVGRGTVMAILVLAFLFGLWFAWSIASPPRIF